MRQTEIIVALALSLAPAATALPTSAQQAPAGVSPTRAASQESVPRVRLVVPGREPAPAPEGHVLVTWELLDRADEATGGLSSFEIEYGENSDLRDAVRRSVGTDRASFLSGLPDGPTYVRVRARPQDGPPGPWSETGIIDVRYPTAQLVRNLMLLGAGTLLALLIVIGRGHVWALRQQQTEPPHGR